MANYKCGVHRNYIEATEGFDYFEAGLYTTVVSSTSLAKYLQHHYRLINGISKHSPFKKDAGLFIIVDKLNEMPWGMLPPIT